MSDTKLSPGTILHTVIGITIMCLRHVLPCPSLVVPANDALMAAACLRESSCTHVRDTETGITLLSNREEAE